MACIVCEPRLTKKAISGGSSDTEVRLPTVIPTGAPAALVEMIATEVGTRPRTRRKSRGSTAVGSGVAGCWTGMSARLVRHRGLLGVRGAMQVVQREHPGETCADSPSRLANLGLRRHGRTCFLRSRTRRLPVFGLTAQEPDCASPGLSSHPDQRARLFDGEVHSTSEVAMTLTDDRDQQRAHRPTRPSIFLRGPPRFSTCCAATPSGPTPSVAYPRRTSRPWRTPDSSASPLRGDWVASRPTSGPSSR